jgi:RNA polymerase sigma-70 factor, ECF subfamily
MDRAPKLQLVTPDARGADEHPPSDDLLMGRVRSGDKAALRELAKRHTPRVLGFCTKVTGDRAASEELTQETWLRVWTSRAGYEARSRFLVFLYTIARNLSFNHLRARKRRRTWLDSSNDVAVAAAAAPDDDPDDEELHARVHAALGELPEPMREALVLRYSQGLSYEQMAAVAGANESTLRSRVFHAVRTLRRCLGEES